MTTCGETPLSDGSAPRGAEPRAALGTCGAPICTAHCSPEYCAEKDAIGSYHVCLEALRVIAEERR